MKRFFSARACLAALVFMLCAGGAAAAEFTVVNKCSYTVYPGIFPATYQNGGWQEHYFEPMKRYFADTAA